jgi:hypothetical protein
MHRGALGRQETAGEEGITQAGRVFAGEDPKRRHASKVGLAKCKREQGDPQDRYGMDRESRRGRVRLNVVADGDADEGGSGMGANHACSSSSYRLLGRATRRIRRSSVSGIAIHHTGADGVVFAFDDFPSHLHVCFGPFESALESASWLLVSGEASGKRPGNRAGRVWTRDGSRKTGRDAIEGDTGRRAAREVRWRGPFRARSFAGLFLTYSGPKMHELDTGQRTGRAARASAAETKEESRVPSSRGECVASSARAPIPARFFICLFPTC